MLKGCWRSLVRNLFLPRDEEGKERLQRAIAGIVELNAASADVGALCQELQTIALQYGQHRQQLRDQLAQQIRMQIEQVMMSKGMQPDSIDFDPTTEPQFKEQWSKLEAELDGQYGQALQAVQGPTVSLVWDLIMYAPQQERIERVQQSLRRRKIDALLVLATG